MGWVLTSSGLWVTQDGGESWNDVSPSRLASSEGTSVFFLDTDRAWVGGRIRGALGDVRVFRTSDGGESWSRAVVRGSTPSPDTPGPPSLSFADAQHGWDHQDTGSHAAFNYGIFFRTTDGGRDWQPLDVPYPAGGLPLPDEFMFLDARRGWLPATSWLYATTDGGSTWHKEDMSLPSGARPGSLEYAYAPVEAGDSLILPVVYQRRNGPRYADAFFVSRDLGATWGLTGATPDSVSCPSAPHPIEIVARASWIVLCGSKLIRTRDSGRTWETLDGSGLSPADLSGSLSFAELRHGWALTFYSGCRSFKSDCYTIRELYTTTDGGNTWQRELAH